MGNEINSIEMIGITAPIIFIIFRLAQGFCLGGEGQGANILTLESYRGQKIGFIGSLLATSNGVAALLAFAMIYISLSYFSSNWGWRIPYLFGSFIAFFGFYLRQKIPESKIFENYKNKNLESFSIKNNMHNILTVILCVEIGSSLTHTGFTFFC